MPNIELDPLQGSWTDGDIRYVMIRADGLMGAFGKDGAELIALERSVYAHGRQSLLRYQAGSADPAHADCPLVTAAVAVCAMSVAESAI